ncbi:MAG TPA: Gfo/Idh/MocA family oxidoreductase [Dehalococcoidia bacterium]|nr:Gfo/Idh/MocA family oxidoreductase [Dehalococcoidia bacterium]
MSSSNEVVRVGLIGAGRNTRERHIPGFQKQKGVEIVAVANRSQESGRRVADQFNIPQVYDDWRQLLEDPGIDAVCIGTWPYMHRTLTVAALEHGKHVLCEARMAASAKEAHEMLAASRMHPELTAQIVPSPTTFKVDRLLMQLIADGYLGDLLAVEVQVLGSEFVDTTSALHWRQDRYLSGYNILNMGIWYEAMIRWVGQATKVMAMTKVNVPYRLDDSGNPVGVTVPDHADVLCQLANGAQAHIRCSAVTGLSAGNEAWLYGSQGTLRVDQRFNVFGGKRGDQRLSEIPNPAQQQYGWRVEEEYINAIRGREPVTRTPLHVGVHYMEWTEAVTRSAQTGQAVSLPL